MTLELEPEQMQALEMGIQIRSRFIQMIKNLCNQKKLSKYVDFYFFSPPGTGKSFSIKHHLSNSDIKYFIVSGNVSMYAFGVSLCVFNFLNKLAEQIIIVVDDCDEIFATEASCNTMKNVLDGVRTFTYEKSLQSQWPNLSELQKEAIKAHQNEEKCGFSVPCDNMSFVFLSNFKLPIDDIVREAREKNQSKSKLLAHKNAIRSRCNVADFDLKNEAHWGWIADVALNTDCLNPKEYSQEEKIEILNFIWKHLNPDTIRLDLHHYADSEVPSTNL
jgi:hypothetical protein